MQQAMMMQQATQPQANPAGLGLFTPNRFTAAPGSPTSNFGGFAVPMNNAEFGAGFRKSDGNGF